MEPPAGECPKLTIKITDWKRVSAVLEKVDTPEFNKIPDDIESTTEIDSVMGALTDHVRIVVERNLRTVPVTTERRKLPWDALELLRTKNAALRHA
ncbi:hypothetical protein EVAR_34727_1 [Eumeta japonica]|uniref:Uncharacterized protein n=1 Tax=Eumeta variegata TaxID=151549 RepID=A0A4C1XEH2_EUMVA|nr:hypothetical protein EVAR_34727_1 [Eumeta japonica]